MYSPGQTLTPACGPADSNCGVTAPVYTSDTATNGAMLFSSSDAWSLLSAGTDGQVLKLSGGLPTWAADAGGTSYTAGSGLSLSGSSFALDLTNANSWTGIQSFGNGFILGGNTYTNLAGTGLSFSSGTLSSSLGASIESSEIIDGTIATADIADSTITFGKLGQNSCATNEIIKWNGSAWACSTDNNTTYTAGTGLSLSSGAFSLNISGLTSEGVIDNADLIPIYDSSASAVRQITRANFLSGITGALVYQGTWDASNNTPTLADAPTSGQQGKYYVVAAGGSQNLGSGAIVYTVGDWVVHNGTKWEKLDNSNAVDSVFGRQGTVTASAHDYDADQIDNIVSGNIVATNVQDAIVELDTEKLAKSLNSGLIFVGNSSNVATGVVMSGDITIDNTGAATIGADKVTLATDTTGNYIATLADSGQSIFTIANSGTENAAVTIALADDSLNFTKLADALTLDAATGITLAGNDLTFAITSGGLPKYTRTSAGQWMNFADGTDTFGIFNTAGTPESSIAANEGSLAIDTANGVLYVKTSDSLNTGWSGLVDTTQSQTIGGTKTFSSAIIAPTLANSINGLIINSGALSGITGLTMTSGNVDMANGLMLNIGAAGTDFTSGGGLNLASDLAINTDKFTVTAASGNTLIAGTLGVTGAITGATSTNTINGLVINAGALSNVASLAGSGALSITSGSTGAITLDSNSTGAVNIGTGNNAKTISIGTGTAGNTINIASDNTTADNVTIGSALDTITLKGNIILDGNVTINGNLLPGTDETYDLGSSTKQWKDAYVSESSIYIGGTALSNSSGSLQWNGSSVGGGGGATTLQSITADATLAGWTRTVKVDATSASVTVTLPTAVENSGQLIEVYKTDSSTNFVKISASSGQTIDGITKDVYLYNQGESVVFRSDGSNVLISSQNKNGDVATITNWQTSTFSIESTGTAPSGGTVTINKMRWRRVGQNMEIEYDYYMSVAGNSGSGTYLLPIPSGYNIDTTNLVLQSAAARSVPSQGATNIGYGYGDYNQTTDQNRKILTAYVWGGATPNKLNIAQTEEYSENHYVVGSDWFENAANRSFSLHVSIPIQGWSAMGTNVVSTVEYIMVTRSSNQDVSNGTTILFNTQVSGNIPYNTSTGVFTLTAGKTYELSYSLRNTSNSAQFDVAWRDNDGATNLVANTGMGNSAAAYESKSGSIIYTPTTNQQVKLVAFAGSGTIMGGQSFASITQIGSTASSGVALSSLVDATANGSLDNRSYAHTWAWSTATTQTGLTMTGNTLTSGGLLNLATSSASASGNILSLNISNASASAKGLSIANSGTGLSMDIQGAVAFKAGTTYTTAGSANNVNFGNVSLIKLDTSGTAQTITGIAGGADGKILTLMNVDAANAVTLSNSSASSSDGNKILTGTDADLTIAANASVTLQYDSTGTAATSYWRVIGGTGSGDGGGGMGVPDYANGQTRVTDIIYQAGTDGYLSAVYSGSYMNDLYIYVGTTNPPETVVWRQGDDQNLYTKYGAAMVPIKKGNYYRVTQGYDTVTVKFYPAVEGADQWTSNGTALYYNDGNVGIGTTAPQAALHIVGSEILGTAGTAGDSAVNLEFVTKGGNTSGLSGASTKGWQLYGRGDAYSTTSERNDFGISYWNGSTWQTPLVFDSAAAGVTMNVGASGLTINGLGSSVGTSYLCNNGGSITYSASACNSSLGVYKTNVEDLHFGLDEAMKLRPVTYYWNKDTYHGLSGDMDKQQVGLIAEEVAEVDPLLNTYNYDENGVAVLGGVDYPKLSVLAIKAIQDQQKEIEEIQNQLTLASESGSGGISVISLNELTISGALSVIGHVVLGEDTVGEAIITAGQTSANITFATPYTEKPAITITPDQAVSFFVNNKTPNGFTVNISSAQTSDITFDWHVFAQKGNAFTVVVEATQAPESEITPEPEPVITTPEELAPTEPEAETTPNSEPEQEPEETITEPTPAPEPVPEPIPNPEPESAPVVEEPAPEPEPTPEPAVEPAPVPDNGDVAQ